MDADVDAGADRIFFSGEKQRDQLVRRHFLLP